MPDLRPVLRGDGPHVRCESRRPLPALGLGQRLVPVEHRPERLRPPRSARNRSAVRMMCSELRSHSSDVSPHAVIPCPQDTPDGPRIGLLHGGDVQTELETGPSPRHPYDGVTETLGGQLLPVGGAGERDAGVGVQMVHVRGFDQPVHRRVDRGRRTALAVQAVVERGDHLVLAVDPGVDVGQRPQPVQPQHGEPRPGQRPEIPTGPLDPHQLHITPGDGVGRGALGGGVPAGVVGVAGVGTETVGTGEEGVGCGVICHLHSISCREGEERRPFRDAGRRPARPPPRDATGRTRSADRAARNPAGVSR